MTEHGHNDLEGVDMNDLQRFLVAEHIEALERDAEGLRAKRGPDRTRSSGRGMIGRGRGRLGAWLVAAGRAIAPTPDRSTARDAPPPTPGLASAPDTGVIAATAASARARSVPCPDDSAPLPRAA